MATVIVGCKLPNGLQLIVNDQLVAVLNGSNSSSVIGGHGITESVDKEGFDTWMAQNKDAAVVKKGFVFAHDKAANVQAEAKDRKDEKTGQEGLDPSKPGPGIKPENFEGMKK